MLTERVPGFFFFFFGLFRFCWSRVFSRLNVKAPSSIAPGAATPTLSPIGVNGDTRQPLFTFQDARKKCVIICHQKTWQVWTIENDR